MYPPPQGMNKLDTGQSDILVLADIWFWLTYLLGMKKLDTGQSDILVLADVPPPPRNWNWTKHECYRNKNHFKRGHQVHFTNLPPPFYYHYLIPCLNKKLVNFNFKWIFGLKPHPPPFSSQKNEMLIFGLRSTSDDQPSNLSNKSLLKIPSKRPPSSHQK